ncbi:MAG: response regulator [Algoriphagus sp.]|nr:response regulator [Algoriphagus sp.]
MNNTIQPYRFLLIEDNFGDFFLIEEYLSEYFKNQDLVHKSTFSEAKLLLDQKETFDVILLDLSLPDHSGEQLIVEMIQLARGIPVIALTGFTDLEFSVKSLSLGVSDYLLKDDLSAGLLYKTLIYAIEREKFIEELQKSERKYSSLFHLSPLPMFLCDRSTFDILDVNDAAILHYGLTKDEFIDLGFLDLFVDEPPILPNESLEGKFCNRSAIAKHVKKGGEIFEVELESSTIQYNDVNACLILINDVTEKNHHLATIEKQNKAFLEIAWIQSHVVRAPLARLMGLLNLLIDDQKIQDEESLGYLHLIQKSAEELDQIIREINKKTESITKTSL